MMKKEKHKNSRINDEELENIRREKKNTKILYKNFGQESISNPYDPFLEWIKELCAENDIETDELLDRCNVYSMHKEVFSSYFNTGHASRNEKPQYMDEDGEIHDVDENYDPKIHKLVYDGSLKVEV